MFCIRYNILNVHLSKSAHANLLKMEESISLVAKKPRYHLFCQPQQLNSIFRQIWNGLNISHDLFISWIHSSSPSS